ncbi:hypothetical protein MP638_002212 [Amoeboaphelidium occidentale]|nr:hypothetical protein MP638_002212 [Amoeboaphelidium occidentale]
MVIMMGAYTAFLALFLAFYDTDHLETLINETDRCDLIGDAKECEHSMFYNYSKIFGRPEWTVNHQPFDNEEHLAKYLAYWQFRNSTSHLNNFEFFRESYEKAMLESVLMKIKSQNLDEITPECEARLVIYDHALYYHPNSRKPFKGSNRPVHGDDVFPSLCNLLQQLYSMGNNSEHTIPNVDFLISTQDIPSCRPPSFATSRRREDFGQKHFMIPYHTWSSKKFNATRPKYLQHSLDLNWTSKADKIFWRGSTTGIRMLNVDPEILAAYKAVNLTKEESLVLLKNTTRYKLICLAHDNPKMDVLFSNYYVETPIEIWRYFQSINMTTTNYSDYPVESAKFKYLLDVGGNSFSDRIKDLVTTQSVILRQEIEYLDFITIALKPLIDYIPVSTNLDDINSKLDWIVQWQADHSNDTASWVTERASKARNLFTSKLASLYLRELFKQYKSSLDFEVTLPDNAEMICSFRQS